MYQELFQQLTVSSPFGLPRSTSVEESAVKDPPHPYSTWRHKEVKVTILAGKGKHSDTDSLIPDLALLIFRFFYS